MALILLTNVIISSAQFADAGGPLHASPLAGGETGGDAVRVARPAPSAAGRRRRARRRPGAVRVTGPGVTVAILPSRVTRAACTY